MLTNSRELLRVVINLLFLFQRFLGSSLTTTGGKGRPSLGETMLLWKRRRDLIVARNKLYSSQCGYFYLSVLTYLFTMFFKLSHQIRHNIQTYETYDTTSAPMSELCHDPADLSVHGSERPKMFVFLPNMSTQMTPTDICHIFSFCLGIPTFSKSAARIQKEGTF